MKWFISMSLLLAVHSTFAQDKKEFSSWIFNVRSHYGFIIPHSETIEDVADSRPWGFQVDFNRHRLGQRVWEEASCYPRVGYTLAYYNFGNPEVLGHSISALAFIEPYLSIRGRLIPSFRLGAGVSYLNNVYDPDTNPQNLFYSFPISFIVQGNVALNYLLTDKINLSLSAFYSHISNGAIKKPNKGINFPTFGLGVDYKLKPYQFMPRNAHKSLDEIHGKRWKYSTVLFFSFKDIDEDKNENFLVLGTVAYASRVVGRLNALHGGVELVFNEAVRQKQESNTNPDRNYDPLVLSAIVGHELLLGKFNFSQTVGIYFNRPEPNSDPIYLRVGLSYKVSKRVFVGVNLKSHTNVADYMDFRTGYTF